LLVTDPATETHTSDDLIYTVCRSVNQIFTGALQSCERVKAVGWQTEL